MAEYYPVFLDLEKFSCLVVGGGEVAARKIESLFQAGADITVISSDFSPQTRQLCELAEINCQNRPYKENDMEGHDLVIAATSDSRVNEKISQQALSHNILLNVVDNKKLSNFIVPSSLVRGPLQLAISTDGASPAMSAQIRKKLEAEFGETFGRYLEIMQEVRELLKRELPADQRRQILLQAGGSEIYSFLAEEDIEAALSHLRELLPPELRDDLEDIV